MPHRNGKGLSHGLKTCHGHVFLTPFRVPPFLLEVAVRQKGLVTLRCCRRRAGGKQQSWAKNMPRACFFDALSSPAFPFGSGSTPEGTRYTKVLPPSSRRQATVHRTIAFEFSSPFYLEYKNGVSPKGYTVFGTPEGTRTPNPRNRNPMLYPLSHWRISESPIIIAGFPGFVKRKWKKILLPADSFCANSCFSQ